MNRLTQLCLFLVVSACGVSANAETFYKKVWNPKYYRWEYQQVVVEVPKANNYHYEYNIQYSQEAAPQGTTVYGAKPVLDATLYEYTDGDLGAVIDAYTRISQDGAKGLDKVTSTIQSRNELVSQQNRQVANALFVEKLTALVEKVNKNELFLGVNSNTSQGFSALTSSGLGLAQSPLVIQRCGACHGNEGSNKDAFDLALGSVDAARTAVLNGTMPKGAKLSAQEKLDLLIDLETNRP